jgi:hypothetical protein
MNFEQPKIEEEKIEESSQKEFSKEEEKEEYEKMMDIVEEADEVFKKRQNANGLGILSKLGLNKKVKEFDGEFNNLIDQLEEKLKKLGREETGMRFFFEAMHGGEIRERRQEHLEESEEFEELMSMIARGREIGREKNQNYEEISVDKEYVELIDSFQKKIEELSKKSKLSVGSIYILAQTSYEEKQREKNKEVIKGESSE